ncbi:recombination protein NinG [Pseudomonas putida]|uniref:NinG protein n=1 Tax=Pseudomonas putida TaxID=303 RepID=A0A2S3WFH3_PSEPU|nr:recombination protein NinG [Pseudomonas putida]POF89655.1 ninG protein [Pseudomonas putida]
MPVAIKQRRQKACGNPACGAKFTPMQLGQKVCGWQCGLAIAKEPANQNVARKAIAQRERREIKVRKEKLKSRGDYLREAQQAFNAFIRMRDQVAGHVCISSGRPLDWNGNAVDAGHYRSVGAALHLRFDERNVHAQSKQDNRYLSGNATDYRIGLIRRIGLAEVEALERDQSVRKYTIDDLKEIAAQYRAKLKALKGAA